MKRVSGSHVYVTRAWYMRESPDTDACRTDGAESHTISGTETAAVAVRGSYRNSRDSLTRYATRSYLRSQQVRAGALLGMVNKSSLVQMNRKLGDFDVIYLHFMVRNIDSYE
jgi:hypothetical protein